MRDRSKSAVPFLLNGHHERGAGEGFKAGAKDGFSWYREQTVNISISAMEPVRINGGDKIIFMNDLATADPFCYTVTVNA